MLKSIATSALLLAMIQAPAMAPAQGSSHAPSGSAYNATSQQRGDCNGAPCEEQQQPRVIVTLPAPAPTPWPTHDRILWAAYLVLVFLGYAGIVQAIAALKKIERNTAATESAAKAAAGIAQASLLQAQAIVNAERPWIMISVEPTLGVENSFNITATNRGRSPGIITFTLDQALLAVEEEALPAVSSLRLKGPSTPVAPIILLPGEYAAIKTIKREDVRELCGSEPAFRTVESWDEKLFLCGKVVYNDLVAPAGKESHETNWCCWYIHGRQKSGLVLAGPPIYHAHT
jgi:hypothetical protein